ncbi:hypothetical protein [Kitasatospora sp. MAP5-34]|uniref:hypothetical protein n=1 Tax=Kitasatospora sp. MAP5-34 TaxID=3035102 RepID=UPI0024743B94|nr:hypothetical protein [Kitasatospora sp. MAP5-34]MDH6580455.1 hypothetical protein [Kitasatospora sp. MAP5-34]
MFFTLKVEYGHPPIVQLSVRSGWARQVAAPGWAVLDGCAVLDVLDWDESVAPRRPARVRAALISADYDAGMHGWRAHADSLDVRVALSPDGDASLVMPWDGPRDDDLETASAA